MTTARLFRGAAGAVALAALIVQYALLLRAMEGDAGAAALRFLTYFTLLSNSFGAAALLCPAVAPGSAAGRFFARPGVRTAAALYLLVVGAVYHAVLASQWDPKGWQLAADIALHTITPAAMLIDWLFLTPKRGLHYRIVPLALLLPLGYGVWALALGAVSGFYPYPFLDVAALGLSRVMLNLLILLTLFAGLGALMVTAGRRLPAAMQSAARIDAGADFT
jgi:hypothetical protein